MKQKITVEKNNANGTISFYLTVPKLGRIFLMATSFSKGVYSYFEGSRSYSEVIGFKSWGRNPRLDRIINRLPALVKYGMSELLWGQQISLGGRTNTKRKYCEKVYDHYATA